MTTLNAIKLINKHGHCAVMTTEAGCRQIVGVVGSRTITAPINNGVVRHCWVLAGRDRENYAEDYFGNPFKLLSKAVAFCARETSA